MVEIIREIPGPTGPLETLVDQPRGEPRAAVVLAHPLPTQGGTMHTKVVFQSAKAFAHIGCVVLRFNFRGVGRSAGAWDEGRGEIDDYCAALDFLAARHPDLEIWAAGFSFGAWIGMQLLMRRPEIERFISLAPPANMFDFSFLAPCPASGLIVHGTADEHVPEASISQLYEKLSAQKTIRVDLKRLRGADHFFSKHLDDLRSVVEDYFDEALGRKEESN